MNGPKRTKRSLARVALVTSVAMVLVLAQGVVPASGLWTTYMGPTLISKGYMGVTASEYSSDARCSDDGRYIVFRSRADNLVSYGTGLDMRAVYWYDRFTNTMKQVSAPPTGPEDADRGARDARISDDGRYVLFFTGLTLLPEDTNGDQDFYVRDMQTDTLRWIDFRGDGTSIGDEVYEPELAGDGSFFIFQSDDYDLLGTGKTTVRRNVWGYDLESDEATLVCAPADPAAIASRGSKAADISDDGRYVVLFTGNAWDAADTNSTGANNGQDFYIKDMDTGTMHWVDFHGDGSELGTNYPYVVRLAGDASRFVFETSESLDPGDTGRRDIYGYDLVGDHAEFISGPHVEDRGSRSPSITDDGRYVMFLTGQSFAADDTNSDRDEGEGQDLYLKDMDTDEFIRIPVFGPNDFGSGGYDFNISGDGEHAVFSTYEHFSLWDTNTYQDVYYYPLNGKSLVDGPERLSGDTRYDTAIALSEQAFPTGAPTAIIATGENWPDALGGSALAGAIDGPILLTPSDQLIPAVKAELERLGAGNVYILGGYGAVSLAVESELNDMLGGFVWRIGGADRYETSAAIAKRVIAQLGGMYDGRVIVATGANYPDAVGGAPLAAGMGWPVILTPPSADEVKLPLDVMGAAILGGESAVSADLEAYLVGEFGDVAVDRLGGDDRYETSAKVAQYGVDNGMVWDGVGIATGTNFPDSLAGGVALGLYRSVLLLTPGDALHPAAETKLEDNKADIASVVYLGGVGAVSETVENAVNGILGF